MGVVLYAAGYGNNNDESSGGVNKELRFAVAGSRITCIHEEHLKSDMICTDYTERKAAFCTGDSGGPLTEKRRGRHFLVGVNLSSDGGRCAVDRVIPEGGTPQHQVSFNVKKRISEILSIVRPVYGQQ